MDLQEEMSERQLTTDVYAQSLGQIRTAVVSVFV